MSAIAKYQAAVDEIKAATADANRLTRIITGAATTLRDWKTAMVSDVSVGFPPEIGLRIGGGSSISGREWPTAQSLAEALSRYHTAKFALRSAYDAIPESERTVVQPPQSFF